MNKNILTGSIANFFLPDLKSEPQQMLPFIKRYEHVPIVSLTQAVKPLVSLILNIEQIV